MKGLYCLLFLIFGLLISQTSLNAQFYDQAIGGRFGTSVSISYKKFFSYTPSPQLAWEILMGFQLDEIKLETNGYVVEGMCYYHFDIGFDTGFSGYAGAGIFMGVYTPQGEKARFGGGVSGTLGAAYTFTHTPVNIALDWKPILGNPRSSLTRAAISIRYVIPTTWQ